MLEHPRQLNITQSELTPRVADYFDNLLAQRDAILARYDLTPETAEEFCNLRSSDEDREKILELYEKMVYVIENKEIPSSEREEQLEAERQKEQERINEFFGEDAHIEVPQLPKTITPERIEHWKQKRFELRYLPPLTLNEEDDYPGWIKKPTKGIQLFGNANDIKNLSVNRNNPHLANLAPNQLAGCWMLIDTRPKPNFQDEGTQTYEDDEDVQTIIQKLAQKGIIDSEAEDDRRNLIHSSMFNHADFWEPFYDYLGIAKEEAIIRLPRVIEQNMFGQGEEWDGTDTFEWAEERFNATLDDVFEYGRMVSGNVNFGGASDTGWNITASKRIGFRPLVVFANQ